LNFADKARIDVPMTSDRTLLEAGIARTDAIGGTALRDAVRLAEDYLHDHARRARRALLVISDGNDNASLTTMRDIRREADSAETVVYAIGLLKEGPSDHAASGRHELEQLTQQTGGAVYFPTSVDQIERVAFTLAHQIRNQYTIGYTPFNQSLDGAYRSI